MLKTIINRLNGSDRVRMHTQQEVGALRMAVGALQRDIQRLQFQLQALATREPGVAVRAAGGLDELVATMARSLAGPPARVVTEHPVAVTSDDHVHPRGTANDDTHHPRFVERVETEFGRKVTALDLGCSSGGLVLDFVMRGHRGLGIEGSDWSQRRRRAAWGIIPDNLFTADITKPFTIEEQDGRPVRCDVITAWEVLEHLPEPVLAGFVDNVRRHLAPGGLFIASVATFEDRDDATGAVWHQTVQPRPWWTAKLAGLGFRVIDDHAFQTADFVRGSGNPTTQDWNAAIHPELGFHVVCRAA